MTAGAPPVPAPGGHRRLHRALLAGTFALAALAALVSLGWPVGFDHGLYTWVGGVVARGGLPYRDAWDMHGPLVGFLFAAPELLVGPRFWGVRVLDVAFAALGTWGVWRLAAGAAPVRSPAAGAWAAAVFALTYASLGYNETAQPDGWVGLAAAAAFAPVLLGAAGGAAGGRPSGRALAVAGLTVGLCTLVKPFYALLGLVPVVAVLAAGPAGDAGDAGAAAGLRVRPAAAAGVLVAAAALAPVAVVLAYFAWRGALGDLVEVHLLYTTRVYNDLGALAPGSRLAGVLAFVTEGKVVPVALAAALAGAAVLWQAGRRALFAGLLAWAALALGFVVLQNKFYYYHWLALLPPVAVLAAVGLDAAARLGGAARALAVATLAVVAAHAAFRPAAYVAQRAALAAGRLAPADYRASFTEGGPSRPADRERVARYLRGRPPGGVAVWGTDAGIVYLSGRQTVSRLGGWYWPVVTGRGTATQRAYAAEYVRDLRARPPAYLVVNVAAGRVNRPSALASQPAVAAAVEAAFERDTVLGPFEVLRRRGAVPPR